MMLIQYLNDINLILFEYCCIVLPSVESKATGNPEMTIGFAVLFASSSYALVALALRRKPL